MAVDTPTTGYELMREEGSWDMLTALLGGTKAMREAGQEYLPKETDEKDGNYTTRLNRSFLYNGYKDTITKCVARPFSKPMTIELPELMKPLIENFDGEGQHIQDFAQEYFEQMVQWNVAHAFADYPSIDDPKGENKKTVQQKGLLPYNRIIPTKTMIGWKSGKKKANEKELTQIRYVEQETNESNDWEQETKKQIWVVEADNFKVYEQNDEEDWVVVDSGDIEKNFEGIPLVTAYAKKKDFMIGLPPLQELGWANVEHWQSLSDQKNILRYCRFGILMAAGFNADEIKKGITVAPTQVVFSEETDAKLTFTEHTGKAVEAGRKDIESIESRMEVLGLQPMLQRYWNVKATGQAINETKSVSQIEMWISNTIRAMKQILVLDAKWMGLDNITEEDIKLEINKDFVFGQAESKSIEALIKAREIGDIDHKTFLMELKRFGVLSDDVNVDDTIRLSAVEQPNLPGLGTDTEDEAAIAKAKEEAEKAEKAAEEFFQAEPGEELQ